MPLPSLARAHRMSDRGWVVGVVGDEPSTRAPAFMGHGSSRQKARDDAVTDGHVGLRGEQRVGRRGRRGASERVEGIGVRATDAGRQGGEQGGRGGRADGAVV